MANFVKASLLYYVCLAFLINDLLFSLYGAIINDKEDNIFKPDDQSSTIHGFILKWFFCLYDWIIKSLGPRIDLLNTIGYKVLWYHSSKEMFTKWRSDELEIIFETGNVEC